MVTFDGVNKLIIMDNLVTSLDVRALYAAWKQWVQELDNLKYLSAFDVVGGNPTIGTSSITPYFFLINGWKIRPYEGNHTLKVEGILLTADESDMFVDTIGIFRIGTQSIVPLYAETTEVNNESIVYSSFQGAVWVDVNSAYSDKGSATHPNGNTERPVNSTQLAVEIAYERGFRKIKVLGDLTLDTGDDVREFDLEGTSHVNSHLIVNAGCLCFNTIFRSFNITGVLDGGSDIFDCVVGDLEYFDGHIHDSDLNGIIKLSGQQNASIKRCSTLDITNPPTIDGNHSLQSLSMPNFSGPVFFSNITQPTVRMGIGLDAGQVMVNPTCTAGTLEVNGVGELFDNSGINCYVVGNLLNGTRIENLQRTIEYLRPHHTNSGDVYYWNPYDGNDEWDGRAVTRAFKTFAAAHDACANAGHDVIMCVSGNPTGLTVTNECITISKDYTFLRGPGRDFMIVCTDDTKDAITVTGRGNEVSGFRVSTGLTSTKAAIRSTGPFTLVKNVYVYESYDGIIFDSGEYCIADNVKCHHGLGTGIQIIGTSDHTDIIDCHIGSNAVDGVSIDISGGHEVNFLGNNIIHKNVGAGVRISATSAATVFSKSTEIFLNGTDVVDNGIDTYYASEVSSTSAQEVWEYGTRELTASLTQEQHNKLMAASTKQDVYNAALL